MSDSVVVTPITTAAESGFPWLLLVACALAVAVLCYGLGWMFHQLNSRFPARTQYTPNKK